MTIARLLRAHGIVQGVGFRPAVYRLARRLGLKGWVLNASDGVRIHVEGPAPAVDAFARELIDQPPPAARIAGLDIEPAALLGLREFSIRASAPGGPPTVRIAPDLPVCEACLRELFDRGDRRFGYPYINCTDCGPRYSIILDLPYDRARTTMLEWALCERCAAEFADPLDRRFHAQPVACPACGPTYRLWSEGAPDERGGEAIAAAARSLRAGAIVAIKGLGGYHLACDAGNARAVLALRHRKFRKEKPFAVMAKDQATARGLVELDGERETLLTSTARPIVLAPARRELEGLAPGNRDLGVMLPYTPLHHLLFAAGAPAVLVMTSANRSNEPIAYRDEEARDRLGGIADAYLAGERPIARRVEDSVACRGALGTMVLRRSRGYAPSAVAHLPIERPVLGLGADLKNAITLVVDGEAMVSQHLGDLEQVESYLAFREAVDDLTAMYAVDRSRLLVVHDLHPQYASTAYAAGLEECERLGVQHHRAHLASVLAERGCLERRVLGVVFDGTGFGDDGTIWGGEFFAGSLVAGFERVAHLRPAVLPGGDAAARVPAQAAAGFLAELTDLPDLGGPPFDLPPRFLAARRLVEKGVRTFATTSAGRLFDTAAALLGFTGAISFEGQAAIWLEHLGRSAQPAGPVPFEFDGRELDFRAALASIVEQRQRGIDPAAIARSFHRGLAAGVGAAIARLTEEHGVDTAALSGGVFQNQLLLADLRDAVDPSLELWTNREVPPNDGGISLGQVALALASERASSG